MPFLAEHGCPTTFAPLIHPDEYGVMYGSSGLARKAWIGMRGGGATGARPASPARFRHRRGPAGGDPARHGALRAAAARARPRLVFDFDDAIWLPNASAANSRLAWLKNPAKTSADHHVADLVFAGNDYLADYARQFNRGRGGSHDHRHGAVRPATAEGNGGPSDDRLERQPHDDGALQAVRPCAPTHEGALRRPRALRADRRPHLPEPGAGHQGRLGPRPRRWRTLGASTSA